MKLYIAWILVCVAFLAGILLTETKATKSYEKGRDDGAADLYSALSGHVDNRLGELFESRAEHQLQLTTLQYDVFYLLKLAAPAPPAPPPPGSENDPHYQAKIRVADDGKLILEPADAYRDQWEKKH